MIYLSSDYILSAINQLSSVHPFMGITFLTCKKAKLPVGKISIFAMDNETKSFMDAVHKICPESKHFFQPYETEKGKQWVNPDYPSHGLNSANTRGNFNAAFDHESHTRRWCWTTDYIEKLREAIITTRKSKIPMAPMAVWIMKDYSWSDTSSIEDVIQNFINEYHITKRERFILFTEDAYFPNAPAFQKERVSWNQLSHRLSTPPDAKPDQAGVLSRLELVNVGPCDRVELLLSSRLNIIIGDNGLGKTFIMDCAWWALTGIWTGNEARPKYAEGSKKASIGYSIAGKSSKAPNKKILYDNRNLTWKRPSGMATIPGLIIYAQVDGSYAVWDPSKRDNLKADECVFTKKQVWDGQGSRIEGLIRDWVKWQNTPDRYPFEIFTQVLAEMSPPDIGPLEPGKPTRVSIYDSREIPTVKYPYGEVPVTHSSAGIGRIITLAYLIVWAWNEHKENCKLKGVHPDSRIVVMVDELEAHLHPKWQRTILPALIKIQKYLADELEVQFIIATHSPLIMASAETIFQANIDKLFHLKVDDNEPNAILTEDEFIKRGPISSWLISKQFGLIEARSISGEKAIEEAKSLQLEDDPSDTAVKIAHDNLVQNLSQDDPFWPRWIYFAESHGVII